MRELIRGVLEETSFAFERIKESLVRITKTISSKSKIIK